MKRINGGFEFTSNALYGIDTENCGRWMCYDEFEGIVRDHAESFDEACEGSVFTMDQDGGEGHEVMFEDLSSKLQDLVKKDFLEQLKNYWQQKQDDAADAARKAKMEKE